MRMMQGVGSGLGSGSGSARSLRRGEVWAIGQGEVAPDKPFRGRQGLRSRAVMSTAQIVTIGRISVCSRPLLHLRPILALALASDCMPPPFE